MAPAHTYHHTIPTGYFRGLASTVRNRPKPELTSTRRLGGYAKVHEKRDASR